MFYDDENARCYYGYTWSENDGKCVKVVTESLDELNSSDAIKYRINYEYTDLGYGSACNILLNNAYNTIGIYTNHPFEYSVVQCTGKHIFSYTYIQEWDNSSCVLKNSEPYVLHSSGTIENKGSNGYYSQGNRFMTSDKAYCIILKDKTTNNKDTEIKIQFTVDATDGSNLLKFNYEFPESGLSSLTANVYCVEGNVWSDADGKCVPST